MCRINVNWIICALAFGESRARPGLIHRDEPLRRVAEDHRLLGAPRMRVLVLQPPARDQHAGIDQGLDDGVVGIALIALVGDDALRLAASVARTEARRLVGEEAIFVDRVGDCRIDTARLKLACMRSPDIEVIAAVTRRRVHETRASVIGDVLAGEERHLEFVRWIESGERMRTMTHMVWIDILYSDVALYSRRLHNVSS